MAIFGTNLASTEATAPGTPLPTELAGTWVTMNGIKTPLFFVSPGQINLETPSSLHIPYIGQYLQVTVVVTTPLGSSAPVQVPAYFASPAAFTVDSSGCGPAVAMNVAPDGTLSLNSSSNSAAPGDYVALFLTGLGLSYHAPPDGSAAGGPYSPNSLEQSPGITIGGVDCFFFTCVTYAGLAPTLVGVDQINLQIPQSTPQGCAVPFVMDSFPLTSPAVTLSIHAGRGQCVDPAVQSYGQVSLTKTIASGTANDGETDIFTAAFPSGPGLEPPPAQPVLAQGSYQANLPEPVAVSRSCPVAGDAQLSAGTIQVRAANTGMAMDAQPINQIGGVAYQQTLPPGFIAPGQYAISASGGAVTLQGALPVGSPIHIQTPLGAGTSISTNQPFTVTWVGGDPGTIVKVTLVSKNGIDAPYDYAEADAGVGTLTIAPYCTGHSISSGGNGVFCSFGLPGSNDAQVIVEVMPAPSSIISLAAQGITGSIQASWTYRYVFGGLALD